MELWLILAIISYLFFGISTSIDKHFMNQKCDPIIITTFKSFYDGIIILIIGLLFFNITLSLNLLINSLILGFLFSVASVLYFTALKLNDVQIVTSLFNSSLIMLTFFGSLIFFLESANVFNYLGIILTIFGVNLILSRNGFRFPKLKKGILIILLLVVMSTLFSLLSKKLLYDIDPLSLAAFMYLFSGLLLSIYLITIKKSFNKQIILNDSKIYISAIFGASGRMLSFYALSIGAASKILPISGIQVVFVFIISSVFLGEKFTKHRLIGTLIVFLSIYLISV